MQDQRFLNGQGDAVGADPQPHAAPPDALAMTLQRGLALSVLVIVTAIWLGGWLLDVEVLVRLRAGYPAIVPATLACSALAAMSLLILNRHTARHRWMVVAGAALTAGLATWFGFAWNDAAAAAGDHMSVGTALAFQLLALALLLTLSTAPPLRLAALTLATAGVVAALLVLVAYVLDPAGIWQIRVLSAMSPLSALVLSLLFAALLCDFTHQGWVRTLFSDTPGGTSARRYVPLAVLGPVLLSYIELNIVDSGLRGLGFHFGVIAVVTACAAVTMILWTAGLADERLAAVARENAQLRAIVDSYDRAAVFVLDHDGAVRIENLRAREMFPPGGPSILDAPFFVMAGRKPLTGAEHPMRRFLDGQTDEDVVVGWTAPDGADRAIRLSAIPLPTDSADSARIIVSAEDETESWLLRAALAETERAEGVGQLSWGVAHEMANIFGIVQISAESARLEAISPKTGQNLDAILQACRRGTDLTHKLLEMTRSIDAEPELHNVTSVLRAVSELAARVMPSFVAFETRFPDRRAMLRCLRTDLESAVLNLLANARNAIAETGRGRGRIELAISVADGMLEIEVTDDGPGIPPELLDRVRDPYFTTRETAGGRGIGLTLVDTFARRAGGTFRILPREPQGTRAVVRVPVSEEGPADRPLPRPAERFDLAGYRLILVENDPMFRNILADGLSAAGASVAACALGAEALDRLANGPAPDIVITNFKLGDGVEGTDLAARLAEISPASRVIFLSGTTEAYARPGSEPPGLVLGKPVQLGELAEVILMLPPLDAPA